MLARVLDRAREPWDIARHRRRRHRRRHARVDAASRGYDVLLLEQSDFGKGTSSRSTKLVHGGVRYLEQGNISLVMEALQGARHCCGRTPRTWSATSPSSCPNYDWWEAPFYGIGLKVYDLLAGKYGFGPSQISLARRDAGAAADHQDRRACAAASSTTTASSTTPGC